MINDEICPWGCGEVETQEHAIFGFPCICALWIDSGCEALCPRDLSSSMQDIIMECKGIDTKIVVKGAFLAWIIWSERNSLVFNHKTTHPHNILVNRAHRYAEEVEKYAENIYKPANPQTTPSSRCWSAPPAGVIKLNVDASLSVAGWVGLSTVARSSDGSVMFAATRRVRACWTAEIAEAKAIEMAVKLGRRYGLQDVVVESDCQVLIHRLSKHAIFLADLDIILRNILSSCTCFKSLVWSHVKRDGNFVAHH